MTREEAIDELSVIWERLSHPEECENGCYSFRDGDYLEALDMAIEALQEVQKHEETFEWCTDCKEYDKGNYCCHRWSKVIRNTVEELKTDRPQGEWGFVDNEIFAGEYFCSICGKRAEVDLYGEWILSNYCPSCGTRMVKGGAE